MITMNRDDDVKIEMMMIMMMIMMITVCRNKELGISILLAS